MTTEKAPNDAFTVHSSEAIRLAVLVTRCGGVSNNGLWRDAAGRLWVALDFHCGRPVCLTADGEWQAELLPPHDAAAHSLCGDIAALPLDLGEAAGVAIAELV